MCAIETNSFAEWELPALTTTPSKLSAKTRPDHFTPESGTGSVNEMNDEAPKNNSYNGLVFFPVSIEEKNPET
jgi:hypothetical protein